MVKLKQKKPPKSKTMKSKKIKPKLTKSKKIQPKLTKPKKIQPKLPKPETEEHTSLSVDDFLNQDFDKASETSDEEQQNFEAEEDEVEAHKKSLEKLKQTDPEFYSFLEENDKKLLKFDVSDGDDDEEDVEEKVHVPSGELEVASDESDFESEEKVEDKGAVNLKLLKKWQVDIRNDKSNQTIRNLVHAFHAALRRVSNNEDDDEPVQFKVGGKCFFISI